MSHLCASTAHESAPAAPAVRCARPGAAAAQSPKAPSTWHHAPWARHAATIGSNGSKAPVFTLPACAQTIVGPPARASSSASAPARIRPCSSAGTRIAVSRPRPSSRSALKTVACASAPTITRSGGAPASPCASTSQPARPSTALRAAASAVALAICAPVHRPAAVPSGRPSSSRHHSVAVRSAAAAAGDITCSAVFWSHADVSQSAASAAGSVPPVTKP